MLLNFRKVGSGDPIFILHGVFGSADNWQSVGREWADSFTVYLIDQRNHGQSPHSEDFDYDVMAEDIEELRKHEDLKKIFILGHSMGGKTAMKYAIKYPEHVEKLVVVDIAPRYYEPHHQQIFEGFHSVDLDSLSSRKDADRQMSKAIGSLMIRQFLLKNLARENGKNFAWKHNLPVIEKKIENIGRGLEENEKYEGRTLFVGGSKSDYITESDHDQIKHHFPNVEIKMVENAGHWVHAEQPQVLTEIVTDYLKNG